MKIKYRLILIMITAIVAVSCYDASELPFPEFAEGVNFRALPSPWTAKPTFSLANPAQPFVLSVSSLNAASLSKVDVYVSYLPNTAVPAAAGTGNFNQFLAPVGIVNWIPEIAGSGNSPVTIAYSRYDQLINGRNAAGVTFPAMPRVLFRTLNESQIVGNMSFTLTELATAAGIALPGSVPASTTGPNLTAQPAFLLIFEVTKKDGSVFSYLNSNPGVNATPATGRVQTRGFSGTDIVTALPVSNKRYDIILSGEEGSPFIPGVSIRIAP